MVSQKGKRKRSRALIILLLPALIFIGIMGWCMYALGNPERAGKTKRKPPKKDNVTLLPIVFEEQQEITNE